MTPLEKQQIWDALYKCTRNGYPGATYETYDSPKDPRVRGGRYSWKRAQLRDIYEQLVKWGDSNEPTAAWRELLKYKTKIPPACLRAIYQSITFGLPTPTYTISTISGVINDGASEPFTVNTTNVPDGTVLYWKIVPTGVNPATSADFVGGVMNGSFVITGNSGGDTINTVDNILWKPDTFFYVEIMTGSIVGPVVTFSGNVEIDRGPAPLRTVWDGIAYVPVADPYDVNEWNAFYNTWSNPFTSVVVSGNTVDLYGSDEGSIDYPAAIFQNNISLNEFLDLANFGKTIGDYSFYSATFLRDLKLSTFINAIGVEAFYNAGNALTITPQYVLDLPDLSFIDSGAFWVSCLYSLNAPNLSIVGLNAFNSVYNLYYLNAPLWEPAGSSPGLDSFMSGVSLIVNNAQITIGEVWQSIIYAISSYPSPSLYNVIVDNFTTKLYFQNAGIVAYAFENFSGLGNIPAGVDEGFFFQVGASTSLPIPYGNTYYYEISGTGISQSDFTTPVPLSGTFTLTGSLMYWIVNPDVSAIGKSFSFSVYEGSDNTGLQVGTQSINIV